MHRSVSLVLLAVGLGLAASLCLPATAAAEVSVRVGVNIGSPPPPPPAFVFEDEPAIVLIPRTRVYYVQGPEFDLFRYGRYWYINNGGWWYRAHNYRGPFVHLEYDKVPRTILRVPKKYHRHPLGGPPGLNKEHPGRALGLKEYERPAKKKGEVRASDSAPKPKKKEWKRDK